MITLKPEGIYVPNVTPFDNEGNIMFDALGTLLDFWVAEGVSGVVVNASTGEGPYLAREEKMQVIEYAIDKIDGRAMVYAGTAAMSTRDTIEYTRDAKEAGAEAALVTTPFFFHPTNDETVHYFIDLMDAVDIPVILYNVPKFTGYSVDPTVVARVSEESSQLVAMKDSSGNPANMAEVIRLCGKKINCLSGSADMILPTLMLGGKGAIVAVGNVIPRVCVETYNAYQNGDKESAGQGQFKASYVNKILVRENPQIAAIKTALNQRGYKAGVPRRPLLPLNDVTSKRISEALKLM